MLTILKRTEVLFTAVLVSIFFISCQKNKNNPTAGVTESSQLGLLLQPTLDTLYLDSFIKASQDSLNIPAVSLALIKDGNIVYHKNYGIADSQTKQPVTSESVFEAASITKPVFAYTVVRLAQKGVIDLDVPLHQRFPFPDVEEQPCYKELTPRHVLTHVSGLPNWGVTLEHCPGEQYGYSGQGFEFLTKALAQSFTEVMDRKIMQYLRQEVLEPFDMNNTYFVESPILTERCVSGHLKGQPNPQEFPESPEMAFGMHCNALDIAKFAIGMHQRHGLNDTMTKEMFRIQTPIPEDEKEFDTPYDQGYGLGFYLRDSAHGKVFGHSGSNYDFMCLFEVYDDLGAGYVIMTNSDTGDQLTDMMAHLLVEGKI